MAVEDKQMSLNDYLCILRNPFSLLSAVGKVPDGKVRLSLGERQQTNVSWSIGLGDGVFLLVPNYTVGYMKTTGLAGGFQDVATGIYKDSDHAFTANGGNFVKQSTAPDRWRLVSAGVKFAVVNNSATNDGWFEAIRLKRGLEPKDYRARGIGAPVLWVMYEEPMEMGGGILMNGSDWSNDPSYMRGKLTDIGKYMFYLQSIGNRDFKSLPSSWLDDSVYAAAGEYEFTSDGMTPSIVTDSNFDRVAIRIHSTSYAGGEATKLIAHTVHNFENVFDLRSVYAKHQTGSYNNPEVVLALDTAINSDPKPGRICINE
jgi:hypothetical protein